MVPVCLGRYRPGGGMAVVADGCVGQILSVLELREIIGVMTFRTVNPDLHAAHMGGMGSLDAVAGRGGTTPCPAAAAVGKGILMSMALRAVGGVLMAGIGADGIGMLVRLGMADLTNAH